MRDYLSSEEESGEGGGQRGCLWPGVLMLILGVIAAVILYHVIPHLAWGEWFRHLTGATRSSFVPAAAPGLH